jgi:hypothetical protein
MDDERIEIGRQNGPSAPTAILISTQTIWLGVPVADDGRDGSQARSE